MKLMRYKKLFKITYFAFSLRFKFLNLNLFKLEYLEL